MQWVVHVFSFHLFVKMSHVSVTVYSPFQICHNYCTSLDLEKYSPTQNVTHFNTKNFFSSPSSTEPFATVFIRLFIYTINFSLIPFKSKSGNNFYETVSHLWSNNRYSFTRNFTFSLQIIYSLSIFFTASGLLL